MTTNAATIPPTMAPISMEQVIVHYNVVYYSAIGKAELTCTVGMS